MSLDARRCARATSLALDRADLERSGAAARDADRCRCRCAPSGRAPRLTLDAGALARSRGRCVVMVAPLSTRNLTGCAVDLAVDPEMAVDRHRDADLARPATTGSPVASARSRCATQPKSSRKVKRTKPAPKIATQASAIFSSLASGSRRADQRAEHQHHRHQQIEAAEHRRRWSQARSPARHTPGAAQSGSSAHQVR